MNARNGWFVFFLGVAMTFPLFKAKAQSGSDSSQDQLVSGNTTFGFRLLKELARERPQANIFISPYSISSVLQMVGNGARGQTKTELQQVLGTGSLTAEQLNSAYQRLSQSISSTQSNLLLNVANAIWYRNSARLNDDFAAANQKFYRAELGKMDFSDPASVQKMNQWASENTHGKIQTIVEPPLPRDTAIILANAIYFKGTWLDQFDLKQTRDRAFHSLKTGDLQVPMMLQSRSFPYQEGSGFQAVQLFYAGKRLEMEILLPDTNSTLETLIGRLDGDTWQKKILPAFQDSKGTLVMPRFKLQYGAELKNPLAALGLKRALGPGADFSAMSPDPLFLSEVKHQSFVEVNEQGTEAAAVTTGIMALASVQNRPPPFQMIVDRPFLFVISEHTTKSVIFIGAIFNPNSSG